MNVRRTHGLWLSGGEVEDTTSSDGSWQKQVNDKELDGDIQIAQCGVCWLNS